MTVLNARKRNTISDSQSTPFCGKNPVVLTDFNFATEGASHDERRVRG
jgi:hypothetical protein